MRNLSTEFKEKQDIGVGKFLKYIDLTLKDGTVLHLTNEHLWDSGFKFEDAVSGNNNFDIGSVIVNQATLTINNMYDDFTDYVFDGAEAVCYVGLELSTGIEKVRICTVTVTDSPCQNSSIISLTCQDNMRKFDRNYSESNLVYPATRLQIIQDACTMCGVTLGTLAFDGSDYVVQSRPDDEKLTFREVLSCTAQIGCQWCRCDEYGRLCVGWYDAAPTELTSGKVQHTNGLTVNLDDVVITGVRVTEYLDSASKEQTAKSYLSGNEGYVLEISGNPLVPEGTGQTIASTIGERCIGMQFRPFTGNMLTDISLEAGDAVIVTDRKGNTYQSYLTQTTIQPGNYQSVSCNAKSAERKSAVRYSQLTQAVANARKTAQKTVERYDATVLQMTQLISQGFGMYLTAVEQENGGVIYYLHDKPTMEESSYVCYWTSNGLVASLDGGTTWAVDRNGNALFNVITARGINADWIDAGRICVKDESGNIIFLVDIDTGQIIIDGSMVQIGGKPLSEALMDATTLTMTLDNDFMSIPVDNKGNYTEFPECIIKPSVHYGVEDITEECVFSVSKSDFASGSWNNAAKQYTVTDLSADTAWVDITAVYLNRFTVTKRFTLSKLHAGEAGPAGRAYYIEASSTVIRRSVDDTVVPSFLDFQAFCRDGDGNTKSAYSGRFVIEETEDGVTWTPHYTSTVDESKIRYHLYDVLASKAGEIITDREGNAIGIPRDLKNVLQIRCKLYTSGGTTDLLDMQSATVVTEVEKLTHEDVFNLLTKNGEMKGIYKSGDQLYISFTYAKGGALTLGGANNGNGRLVVEDADGNVVGLWNKDGIDIRKGSIKGANLILGGNNNQNGVLSIVDADGNEIGHWDKDGVYSTGPITSDNPVDNLSIYLNNGVLYIRGKDGKITGRISYLNNGVTIDSIGDNQARITLTGDTGAIAISSPGNASLNGKYVRVSGEQVNLAPSDSLLVGGTATKTGKAVFSDGSYLQFKNGILTGGNTTEGGSF